MFYIDIEKLRQEIDNINVINIGKQLAARYFDNKILFTTNKPNYLYVTLKLQNLIVKFHFSYNGVFNYSCECKQFETNNKICTHLICLFILYNNYLDKAYANKKQNQSFELIPITFNVVPIIKKIDLSDNELSVMFYYGINFFKIYVKNLSNLNLKQNNFYIFDNFLYCKLIQFDNNSKQILNDLKNLLVNKKLTDIDYFIIENLDLKKWMWFFSYYQIPFFYQTNNNWTITRYNLNSYSYELPFNLKPATNSKHNFILKSNFKLDYLILKTEKTTFLFLCSVSKFYTYIFEYDSLFYDHLLFFCEYINKQISKNNFYKLYLVIKKAFSNYKSLVSDLFLVKHNVNLIDPLVKVQIKEHEVLKVLTASVSIEYDQIVYQYNAKETNYSNRQRFLEESLLKPLLGFFTYFNNTYNVFEIIDMQKYYDFLKWSKKMIKNNYYQIEFAKNLMFKSKKKYKFSINTAQFENNFFVVNWKLEGFSQSDMEKIIAAYKAKEEFVVLTNNNIVNIANEIDFDDFNQELKLLNSSINQVELNSSKVNQLNANYLFKNFDFNNKQNLIDFYTNLYDDNLNTVTNNLPKNLNNFLKPYQITGYLWLKKIISLKAGCILADEMGLGKTIQAIALLTDFYSSNVINLPSLIVCPSSLVYNWKKEFETYAKQLNVVVIDGNQNERKNLLANIKPNQIIITSYHLLNNDIKIYSNLKFYLEILDEAQKIKNHYTLFANDVKAIRSKNKIALTGTPIENNLLELWSIFDFLMPNFLYDFKTFKSEFQDKISQQDNLILTKLKTKIAPFILRRTKSEVLKELPAKTDKTLMCELDDNQKQLYLTELNKTKLLLKKGIIDKSVYKQGAYIFATLTKLRQICCCPMLVYENSNNLGNKFNMCMDLIKDLIKNNNKILLFSQFTSMLSLIAIHLEKNNINFLTLTGSTNKKERMELVKKFNVSNKVKVFLISLKAGGVGITLNAASAIIHYDPWWNLSLENQATDRAHRIGQEKNVFIYKLVTKDTIEEKIIGLQQSKKAIVDQIFDASLSDKSKISIDQILEILEV